LYLLNSPFLLERARSLAARPEVATAPSAEERVDALHRLVFARPATARERELGARLATAGIAEAVAPKPMNWAYGVGVFDAPAGQLKNFEPLPKFTGSAWQLGDGPAAARLTATGGYAGADPAQALVRRWTSPVEAVVRVTGKIQHMGNEGDGVRAVIVSSRAGELAAFNVKQSSAEATLAQIHIKPGDTLDFLVLCRADAAHDAFNWSPVIRRDPPAAEPERNEWNAAVDFSGPPPVPLTAWEKYAQVLLLTNEFAFVD
jgi:hypothetical protein